MVQRRSPKRDRQLVVIGTGEMLVDKAAAFAQIAQRFERHEATQEDIDALGGRVISGRRPPEGLARPALSYFGA
jgi:thioredoxin reductase